MLQEKVPLLIFFTYHQIKHKFFNIIQPFYKLKNKSIPFGMLYQLIFI